MCGDVLIPMVSGEHEEFLTLEEIAMMQNDVNWAEQPEDFMIEQYRKLKEV